MAAIGVLIGFVMILIIVTLFHRIKNNKESISQIEKQLINARKEISDIRRKIIKTSEPKQSKIIDREIKVRVQSQQNDAEPSVFFEGKKPFVSVPKQKQKQIQPVSVPQQKVIVVNKDRRKSDAWIKVEKVFLENWIGIIGSLVMVLGVGFLGVYAAVKLNEIVRFIIISSIAVVFFVLFLLLRKKEFWLQLALLLRSASAAIFLFSCLGAGHIPGLRFIENPGISILVLGLGIVINLVLALTCGKQIFASMHTLFSLAALAIAPQNNVILVIAAVVALIGVFITFWQKWQYHLLLTTSLFFIFLQFWIFKNPDLNTISSSIGIIIVLLVNIPALLIHYHKIFTSQKFERKPFFIHLLTWIYLCISLLTLSASTKWTFAIILLTGAAVFILARQAKRLKIRWLYICDTLIAQVITYAGIISLAALKFDESILFIFMLLETFIFCVVMLYEKEKRLYTIGQILLQVFGFLISVVLLIISFDYDSKLIVDKSALIMVPTIAALIFSLLTYKSRINC